MANHGCKNCATIRITSDWSRAEWTGRCIKPGNQVLLFYGDNYFSGNSHSVCDVAHDHWTLLLRPFDAEREAETFRTCRIAPALRMRRSPDANPSS